MHFVGIFSDDLVYVLLTVVGLVVAWGWKDLIFVALQYFFNIQQRLWIYLIAMIILTFISFLIIQALARYTSSSYLAHGEETATMVLSRTAN